MSNRVLSCLVDPTDVSGLVDHIQISAASVRFLIDNVRMGVGACDGVGKPMGLLNPQSAVPICETAAATAPGQFSWQDLVMLKWEIPMQWQAGSNFYMNQRTAALLFSMSDTTGRPLLTALPERQPGFMLAGSPIVIVSQLPDVAPGATPVMYGNLQAAYTVVDRRAVTMLVDPYSAGWCSLFKFEARLGGACTCSNAVRLLRIR
jgi:HK97 family phage major capsid protein